MPNQNPSTTGTDRILIVKKKETPIRSLVTTKSSHKTKNRSIYIIRQSFRLIRISCRNSSTSFYWTGKPSITLTAGQSGQTKSPRNNRLMLNPHVSLLRVGCFQNHIGGIHLFYDLFAYILLRCQNRTVELCKRVGILGLYTGLSDSLACSEKSYVGDK